MDVFWFLLPPLAACLVLTGIHVYLGLHIVSRGVIFVDLALAQVAALGATAAALFGHDLHGSSEPSCSPSPGPAASGCRRRRSSASCTS
jgi:ABC-type Mn2+/Zn2+ transport system permease subunit